MVRYRRFPFDDQQPPAPSTLDMAALPFVQQVRLHLAAEATPSRRSAVAAVLHEDATVCWLDAKNDRLLTTAPAPVALTLLRQLLCKAQPPLRLAPVNEDAFVQNAFVSSNIPLRPTLWDIGLQTATQGRLMEPLQMDARLRLQRWPDFRILAHRPDHFRICALLIKQGISVQACCQILDMPLQTVQAFFNAAFLTAYAIPVMGEEAPIRPSPTDSLANLWRQLRIRWSA